VMFSKKGVIPDEALANTQLRQRLRWAGPGSPAVDIGRRCHAGAWHDEIYYALAIDRLFLVKVTINPVF